MFKEEPGTSESAKKKLARLVFSAQTPILFRERVHYPLSDVFRLYAAQLFGKGVFLILGISLIANEVDVGPVLEFARALPVPINKTVNLSSD
jgi:hypothetical protein